MESVMNSAHSFTAVLGMVLLLSTATVGCSGPRQDSDVLQDTAWVVTGFDNGSGELVEPVAPEQDRWRGIVLEFDSAGRVSGNGGINQFGAEYKAKGDGGLTFGQVASTLMGGPEELMEQESAFFSTLGKVAKFHIDEGAKVLELSDAHGKVLITAAPREDRAFEGTDWVCTGYNNGTGGFVSVLAETEITAVFENKEVSGTSGVNRYHAAYTLEADRLTIAEEVALTKMAGPEDAMAQEQAYLAALGTVVRYEIAGDELTLYAEGDSRAASFAAASGTTSAP